MISLNVKVCLFKDCLFSDLGPPIVCGPCPGQSLPLAPTSSVGVKFCVVADTTESGWAWDVLLITVSDSATGIVLPVYDFFDSGSVYYDDPSKYGGYHVKNAFNAATKSGWGGRKDEKTDTFYLGGSFTCLSSSMNIVVEQDRPGDGGKHKVYAGTSRVYLKVMNTSTGSWTEIGELALTDKHSLKLELHNFAVPMELANNSVASSADEAKAARAKSSRGQIKYIANFHNNHSEEVDLIWKNYEGEEVIVRQGIVRGAAHSEATYFTHPFIARDVVTGKVVRFSANGIEGVVFEGLNFGAPNTKSGKEKIKVNIG